MKSSLLRTTADEFDGLMERFDRTKQTLIDVLNKGGLREDVIANHVRAFDEGKKIIEELLPIRDQVTELKSAIVEPVAAVIADTADTNKRFGWLGMIGALLGILATVTVPYFVVKPGNTKEVLDKLSELNGMLRPIADLRASADAQLLLYDRFETDDASLHEIPRLLDAGDIGTSYGYESVGFQPRSELTYKPIAVPCPKGCRVSVEAMVRLAENVSISTKQIMGHQFTVVPPIEVQYSSGTDAKWQVLAALQSWIRVEWIASKNQWQPVKTPYVPVPTNVGMTRLRLILRQYQWIRARSLGQVPVRCGVAFDEIKVFVTGMH